MNRSQALKLAHRFVHGLADLQEQEEFLFWVKEEKADSLIAEVLGQQWEDFETGLQLHEERKEALFQSIIYAAKLLEPEEPARIRFLPGWMRRTAAAAILLLFFSSVYLLLVRKDQGPKINVNNTSLTKAIGAPEKSRAIIILADGSVVHLDSVGNGELAMQHGVMLVKRADGEIVYSRDSLVGSRESGVDSRKPIVSYNTLSNPKGSKVIHMQLSDGSHVWLNAGSSVTYPVAFAGNERKVSITGEAYFEASSSPSSQSPADAGGGKRKFIVEANGVNVEVLGTKFNVNAYDDESDIRVTLLEGSVGVSTVHRPQLTVIKPGEQAIVNRRYEVKSAKADVEAVMAWKNGRFVFEEKTSIQVIMRQIARWYDVDVEYKGTISQNFGGSISRQVNVSEVIKVLEATGGVKCKVEGRKVTVMQKAGYSQQ